MCCVVSWDKVDVLLYCFIHFDRSTHSLNVVIAWQTSNVSDFGLSFHFCQNCLKCFDCPQDLLQIKSAIEFYYACQSIYLCSIYFQLEMNLISNSMCERKAAPSSVQINVCIPVRSFVHWYQRKSHQILDLTFHLANTQSIYPIHSYAIFYSLSLALSISFLLWFSWMACEISHFTSYEIKTNRTCHNNLLIYIDFALFEFLTYKSGENWSDF